MVASGHGGGRSQAGNRKRRSSTGGRAAAALGRERLDRRIRALRLIVLAFLVVVAAKTVVLTSASAHLVAMAKGQHVRTFDLPAHRGAIYDRNGDALAIGQPAETVYATPYLLTGKWPPSKAAAALAGVLQMSNRERRDLSARVDAPKSGFAYVMRRADPALVDKALALGIPGVGSYAEERREYPTRKLGTQILGIAGDENKGLGGLELQYDKELSGSPGKEVVMRDAPGTVTLKTISATAPRPGLDLHLTIDQDIQYTTEAILARTVRDYGAKGAVAVVLDPRTGEIYALANVPVVSADRYGIDPAVDRNRAVVDAFEPGSIFKLITVAGVLSEGLYKPTSKLTLPPSIRVADKTIQESHARGTVRYSVSDIIVNSSNVGAVTLGLKLGKAGLLKWIDRFGFGRPTGLAFPGADSAVGLVPQTWSGSTIGNVPMGQGIAVTALQMAQAYAAIANDGVMMKPHLVSQVGANVIEPEVDSRVVSVTVARQIKAMLIDVVKKGTGMTAQIPGYTMAGKTGTANKPLANGGGYSKTAYVASFCGIVPAEDPQLVIFVAVDEPNVIWGSAVAAPAVGKIAAFALQHLEIAPRGQ